MIDDVIFDILYDYNFDMFYDNSFERIFRNYFHFPQKRIVLTFLSRLLTFRYQVSTICWKIFYDSRFEMIYDFHFEMSNAFLFSFWNALWLSFWNEGAKFSSTELFSSGKSEIFYWRKSAINNIFRIQIFTQCQCPYTCVEIYFKKGDGLLCQILIILQC